MNKNCRSNFGLTVFKLFLFKYKEWRKQADGSTEKGNKPK